jgi:hypothetical protein
LYRSKNHQIFTRLCNTFFMRLILAASLLICLFSFAPARAQAVLASTAAFTSKGAIDGGAGPAATAPAMVVLMGKITNPSGPLPGAVVILTGTKQMAVTNADGEFAFEVPANAGALQATVTYAGYADEAMSLNASADESTVSLTNARVIVVSHRNQLKKYLKTAHKQVKHDLKQLHKN